MLFSPKYIEKVSEGIADAMLIYSKNSALGIIVINDSIKNSFYEKDLEEVINKIENKKT